MEILPYLVKFLKHERIARGSDAACEVRIPFASDGEAISAIPMLASAPLMLEVCEMVLEFATVEMPSVLIDKATAAIREAEVKS